jgi:drug/metabolite transporter (DMT)-like permease
MTRTKRRTRGFIAVAVSGTIAALIYSGFVTPHPEVQIAYLLCVGVALWGLIDIAWSFGQDRSDSGE